MKIILTSVLALAICLVGFGGAFQGAVVKAASADIKMIVTNPGEDASTQMNVGFHAPLGSTGCYVQYTTVDDTSWASAETNSGTYNTYGADSSNPFYGKSAKNDSGSDITQSMTFLDYNVNLTDLTPDTDYMYRIYDGAAYSDTYYFKTAANDDSEWSFLVTGDFHEYYKNYGVHRADQATKAINAGISLADQLGWSPVEHIVSIGDIVAWGVDYGQWQNVLNQPWIKNYSFANAIGNHDDMDRSSNSSSAYNSIVFNNPLNGYNSGDEMGTVYYYVYNNVLFIYVNYLKASSSAQEKWAQSVVDKMAGQYKYSVLVNHRPATNKYTGKSYSYFWNYWADFCDKNHVDLVLAGDHHVYMRSQPIYNGAMVSNYGESNPDATVYLAADSADGERGSSTDVVAFDSSWVDANYYRYDYSGSTKDKTSIIINVGPDKMTTQFVYYEDSSSASHPSWRQGSVNGHADFYYGDESYVYPSKHESTGSTEDPDNSGLPPAKTNFLSGSQYKYSTSVYPGSAAYYSYAYYGDNASQGGSFMTGKLNDGVIPANGNPGSSNTDWAVFFLSQGNPEVTLELAQAAYLNKINIVYRNNGDTYGDAIINSIGVSAEDGGYTDVTSYTTSTSTVEGNNYMLTVSFTEPVSAAYIRLVFTKPGSPASRVAIGEIEVWGDESIPVVEEEPDNYINVAGNAQYKGTEGDDNGTSGNYCDTPIGEWLNYHTGKLNDGVIPEGDSDDTKGQNVEIWNAAMSSGYNTIIFKLEETTDVKQVNVYMNNRTSNTNTGYPEKIEIYVGNDEDMATATLMGEAVTTDPEGDIRKYTVSGDLSGQYVFVYFTVGEKWRITVSEVEIMKDGTPANHAPNAEYKGEGDDNGTTGNYCEVGVEWDEYHKGKLNDGYIAEEATEIELGVSVEFNNPDFANGINHLTFKLDYEVAISEVIAYFNTRSAGSTNRGYPATVNVYVGNSENIEEATLMGEATTTDEGFIRAYSVKGDVKGTYVIFEMNIASPVCVLALTEVEILGFGDALDTPDTPKLDAPVLSGNLTQLETFDAPTITWEAVEGAVAYDVYLDGVLVVEDTEDTSYVPDMEPVITYDGNTNYTKVQVVAKGDGETAIDSALSESYNFFYVAKPVDLRGNKVETADILIDPGHGGTQPGACGVYPDGSERMEKVDTLNMSLKLGEYFEKLGYTVAYTRITDSNVGLMSRAAMANAGTFRAYICVHRNSFEDARANGIETLYETGDATDQALAQSIQDAMMELGGFTDRGLKPRDNLVVLNNTSAKTPLCLVELSFISNENDNNMFDAMFNDLALAIVKGTMNYLGDDPFIGGTVTVGDEEYTYDGTEIVVDIDALLGEDFSTEIKFDLSSRFDVIDVFGSDAEGSFDIEFMPKLTTPEANVGGADGSYQVSLNDILTAGTYTYTFSFTDKLDNEHIFLTLNINFTAIHTVTFVGMYDFVIDTQSVAEGETAVAPEAPVVAGYKFVGWDIDFDEVTEDLTVTAIYEKCCEIGDVNSDEAIDNLDAALILKYDAAIIDETGLNLSVGDVNNDGYVDNLDAVVILKYDAGIIDRIEEPSDCQ